MYCGKCGRALTRYSAVCPYCNQPTGIPEEQRQAEMKASAPMGNGRTPMLWGIAGLICSISFYLSILGIIFSAIGLSKSGGYARMTGSLSGMARAGKIMSIIGLVIGIIVSLFFLIWLFAILAVAM